MSTDAVEYGQQVAEHPGTGGHSPEGVLVAAAVAGDKNAFRALADQYRRELHVHCYRMLGSFHDAEDAVQETLLRAWRHLASFEGRSSFRAWLYRIATNVCLTKRRRPVERPPLPPAIAQTIAHATEPEINLTPYPDALLNELEATSGDPTAEIELRESVQLAFLAAVQLLPPRQRAALILHDVVGFSLSAIAEMLESTTASVNSALNRARTTLEGERIAGRLQTDRAPAPDDVAESLARRYGEAWLAMDIARLIGLLKHDVVLTMPPLPLRVTGHDAVARFFQTLPLAGRGLLRCIPTRANREPALAIYRRDTEDDEFRAWGIWVLTTDGDAIAEVAAFVDPALMAMFGLPSRLGRR